jgi:hypothetical protein
MLYLILGIYFVLWLIHCVYLLRYKGPLNVMFALAFLFLIPISWAIFWIAVFHEYMERKR